MIKLQCSAPKCNNPAQPLPGVTIAKQEEIVKALFE
jgi:hypothetical protein